jgi:hypothetical protein
MAHRNSYKNEEPHHLYAIIDKIDDSIFKYGISCKPIGKDGISERMREQVNLINRIDRWNRFFAVILIVDIQGKRAARHIESQHIRDYEKLNGERPRGNPVD